MSFKILLKQSFRSLSKKFRLYLSLIIFLFVAFSILAGTATYFTTYRDKMENIIYTGKIENFEIPKFRFADSTPNKKDSAQAVFQFTTYGQKDFITYADKLLDPSYEADSNDDSNNSKIIPQSDETSFVNELGQAMGDVSLVNNQKSYVSSLNDISKYWGHNLIQMYLANKLSNDKNYNAQVGIRDTLAGTEAKHRNITFNIRPLNAKDGMKNTPFANNDLNQITMYGKQVTRSKGIKFYVSQNYLRYTNQKVGQDISIVVNNTPYNGYIAGTAADKYHIFFHNDTAEVYTDLDTVAAMSNNNFISAEQLIGYLPLGTNTNSFDNPKDFLTAYNRVNYLLLSDGNDPNPNAIFKRVNKETSTPLVAQLDNSNATINFFHEPLNLYMGFMAVLIVVLIILIVIVTYFIIDESIRSERNTLWFLKALGVNNFKLSLLNSMSAIVPLVLSLAITIPGTMLIMEFFTIAISTDYSFSIPWYALTWMTALMIVCFLVGILGIFMIINGGLLAGKGLNAQSANKMSKFQIFLSKVTNPIVAKANGKFRVGFAFVKQNLIKNLVSFVLFLVVFSITLFGIQFIRSIHNQEYQYQNWMGDYHAISTLSPKQTITWDKSNTTYQMIDNDEYLKKQGADSQHNVRDKSTLDGSSKQETNKHLASEYDYDGFKYIALNWFNAIDESDSSVAAWLKTPIGEEARTNYMVINSVDKSVVSLPDNPAYYTGLMTRLAIILSSNNVHHINPTIPEFFNYDQAVKWWSRLNDSDDDAVFKNTPYVLNINHLIPGEDYYGELAQRDEMNVKAKPQVADLNVSLAQWSLRQMRNLSLWNINADYLKTLLMKEEKLSPKVKQQISEGMDNILSELPKDMKPVLQTIKSIYNAQKNIFGVEHPSFGFNFGNIVNPDPKNIKSSVAISATYKGVQMYAYGMNPNDQPFTTPVKIPSANLSTAKGEDGLTYNIIDAEFSAAAENIHKWKVGDIVPVDVAHTGFNPEQGKNYLALRIAGFDNNDSVLTEAFFNKQALNTYIEKYASVNRTEDNIFPASVPDLDNTFYTKSDVPYFLQHITVPHMNSKGTSIDDYIYSLDTFTSSHKTTAQITKVFADTVDSYSSLMSKVIILLVVIAVAISSIIITLILFENKKTILLFKAMGYQKREVIWYIISGYLIASLAALGFSFGVSAGATVGLAPMFADKIFLQLIFTTYWLWFVVGIFLTLGFMALVIISVVTYTRVLKPRDAFATL